MDDDLITPAVLESLAGTRAFRRSEAYFSVLSCSMQRPKMCCCT